MIVLSVIFPNKFTTFIHLRKNDHRYILALSLYICSIVTVDFLNRDFGDQIVEVDVILRFQ